MSEHHENPLALNPPPGDFTVAPPPQSIVLRPMWDPAGNCFRFSACLMVADTKALRFTPRGQPVMFAAIPFGPDGALTVDAIRAELAKMNEATRAPLLVPA